MDQKYLNCDNELVSHFHTDFSLADNADETSLEITDKSEISLQFLGKYIGLSPFGRHEMTHCLNDTDSCLVS